jgi:hypothetical protein
MDRDTRGHVILIIHNLRAWAEALPLIDRRWNVNVACLTRRCDINPAEITIGIVSIMMLSQTHGSC